MDAPHQELVAVLREARALLARPGNDFAWSSWEDAAAAVRELEKLMADLNAGVLPRRLALEMLFAPTGPIQEVGLSSGWADEFLALASRFDAAVAAAYPEEGRPATPVRFEDGDAWVLWCIREAGCDLETIIHTYTFAARDAVPTYDRLAGCLARAVRAGVIPAPEGGRYRLTPEWFARINSRNDKYRASEYGLMEFEDEEFVGRDWPAAGGEFVLDPEEYERAAAAVRAHHDQMFGGR